MIPMFRRRDGFTFLELAVVVVIMGVMMSITLPRFTSTFSRATLGGVARRLSGTMMYLRNAASKDGRSYFLNVDLDKEEYRVTVLRERADQLQTEYQDWDALEDEAYIEYRDDFIGRTRLEKQIAFERVILEDGSEAFDGIVRIEFRPDGTADDTVIRLMSPNQRVYTIHLEHYNGQARVYKYAFLPEPPPELFEREPPRRLGDEL